jgi:hypothetical protein
MRRILFASVVAVITLSACSGSSGPSQAQLTAESKWQHGQGGKYLALVSDYLKGINQNVAASFFVAGQLSTASALASAFPPPIDTSTYRKVMLDYGTAGYDLSKSPPDVNGFIAKIDAAGGVLTTVKPPWGASLPGGKNF